MGSLGGFMCFFLVVVLIKILHKLWWAPTRIQKQMALQGIHGPPYKLTHGNTKEISHMMKEAMARPKTISHDTLPLVQPHIQSWTKIYGKNYLQWHGSQAQLVITEPELCKEILNNKDGAYPKKEVQNFVKKLLGDGLVSTTESEKWAKLRKLATLAFHGESLKSMIPEMVASAETMLGRWKNYEGKEIDVVQEFRLLSSEVIATTAFGSSYIEGKNIFEMLTKLGFIIYKNYLTIRVPVISKFFKTSDEIESEKLEKGIQDSTLEIIKKREEKAMTGEDRFGSDYLGLLVEAQHDANDNQRISVDEVVDDCKMFYMSGQETTTTLLSWTVLLLAVHTDWQEEERKEFIQLFGKQTPHPDGIAKLKTVRKSRTQSIAFASGRNIFSIKFEILICYLLFHFRADDSMTLRLNPPPTNNNIGAFIPFGLGPRTCVGLNFGTLRQRLLCQ